MSALAWMTNEQATCNYANRLYAKYIESQMKLIRDISLEGIRRDFRLFNYNLQGALPRSRGAAILDIGCGYGALVHFLHSIGFSLASGIDKSTEMVEAATKLKIPNIALGDARDLLRVQSNAYELITAFDVLEHLPKEEILPTLDSILTALKPGGAFVMQAPNAMSRYGQWYRYYDFTHEVAFDGQSIRQCLNAVGFEDIRVRPLPPVVHGLASAIRRVYWIVREPLLKVSFALECGWQGGQVFTANLIASARKPS